MFLFTAIIQPTKRTFVQLWSSSFHPYDAEFNWAGRVAKTKQGKAVIVAPARLTDSGTSHFKNWLTYLLTYCRL